MAKIVLADNTEISLLDDLNINGDVYEFVIPADSYADLGEISAKLTSENLKQITVEDRYGTATIYYNFTPSTENKFIIMKETGLGLTVMIRLRKLEEKDVQLNTLATIVQDIDDEEALSVKFIYPSWDTLIGQTVKINTKFIWYDKLYKTKQDNMLIQKQWQPGTTGTESLYEYIDETHEGTYEDPIEYAGNMTLEKGKFYSQNGVVYVCTNGSGIAVYDNLEYLGAFVARYTSSEGTEFDPIVWYGGGLPIEEGKFYSQNGELYIATASSEIPVWGDLSALAAFVMKYEPVIEEPEIPSTGEDEDEDQGEPGDSADNPIAWNVGDILYNGKYYKDKDVIYLCIRDSGIAMHYNLADLVSGGYVQVVE